MKLLSRYSLIIFIILGMVACGSSNTPEKVVESFYSNLASGKVNAAIDLIDFSELKDSEMTQAKTKLTAMFSMMIEEAKKQGADLGKVTVKDVKYTDKDTKAMVTITIKNKQGEKTETIPTVKHDGKWKILLK